MNDLGRLPKWAQELIEDIKRQRDVAIRALNEYIDHQTPSPFFTDDLVCTGESSGPSTKRSYFQAHSITVEYAGIELNIYLRESRSIDLQWSACGRSRTDEIAFIPGSFMQAHLVSKENMR